MTRVPNTLTGWFYNICIPFVCGMKQVNQCNLVLPMVIIGVDNKEGERHESKTTKHKTHAAYRN